MVKGVNHLPVEYPPSPEPCQKVLLGWTQCINEMWWVEPLGKSLIQARNDIFLPSIPPCIMEVLQDGRPHLSFLVSNKSSCGVLAHTWTFFPQKECFLNIPGSSSLKSDTFLHDDPLSYCAEFKDLICSYHLLTNRKNANWDYEKW